MTKSLTTTISPRAAQLIREFARAHNATYASAIEACVYHSLQSGGPAMTLEPYGVAAPDSVHAGSAITGGAE